MEKKIIKVHSTIQANIDDLITRRALPTPWVESIDPFLFLNHHGPQEYPAGNQGLPFGPHPHRGFETLTVVIDGDVSHFDSAGNESIIESGGIQWMTAGSGLVHSEVSSERFKKQGGRLELLQLWINLPSALKMTKPQYVGLQKEDIPVFTGEKFEAQIISGSFFNTTGGLKSLTDVHMSFLRLGSGCELNLKVPNQNSIFFYVVDGELTVGRELVNKFKLVEFAGEGENILVKSSSESMLFFGHAAPLNEPVASYGPFVMNTKKEIEEAIHDYQNGKFQ